MIWGLTSPAGISDENHCSQESGWPVRVALAGAFSFELCSAAEGSLGCQCLPATLGSPWRTGNSISSKARLLIPCKGNMTQNIDQAELRSLYRVLGKPAGLTVQKGFQKSGLQEMHLRKCSGEAVMPLWGSLHVGCLRTQWSQRS